jgi:hypothetical protein
MLESVKEYYNSEIKYKSRLHKRRVKEQALGLASLVFVALGGYQISQLPEELNYSLNAYLALKKEPESANHRIKPRDIIHPRLEGDLFFGGILFGLATLLQVTKVEEKKGFAFTYRDRFMENWVETRDWEAANQLELAHRILPERRACPIIQKKIIASLEPHIVAKNPFPISEN